MENFKKTIHLQNINVYTSLNHLFKISNSSSLGEEPSYFEAVPDLETSDYADVAVSIAGTSEVAIRNVRWTFNGRSSTSAGRGTLGHVAVI